MITLLVLAVSAVAVVVAGASMRRKKSDAMPEVEPQPCRTESPTYVEPAVEPTVTIEATDHEEPIETNVDRTLQPDAMVEVEPEAGRTESPTYAEPAVELTVTVEATDHEEPIETNVDRTLQSDAVGVEPEAGRIESPTYVEPAVESTVTNEVTELEETIDPGVDQTLVEAEPQAGRTESPTYVEPAVEPTAMLEATEPENQAETNVDRTHQSDPTYEIEIQPERTESSVSHPAEPTLAQESQPEPTIVVTEAPRENEIIREPKPEKKRMSRIVKGGLIQTSLACDTSESLDTIREAQTERTLKYIDQAGAEGVQVLCMQEIFTGPYFCAEQSTRWYDSVEKIPDGPTTKLMQEYAKKYSMVIVVPLYEEEETGVYYNTAAVIDADGKYLGKYRKNHIPHVAPGFWEKFYFRPGNLGYPVFETAYAKVGVYICYDRHFPEGARELGLAGAEIVMNPSATVAGLSEYLWKLEQPAHAVANGYFVGAINRVGFEAPWNIGEFYGQSYFCDPRGQMLSVGPRDQDALVTADLDMDKIREVRNTWQFYRDRRPETYNGIVRL